MRAKAYAKLNIFLKIVGIRGDYHEIVSRFVKLENLYDEIEFIPGNFDKFTIEGTPDIKREENIIYKAFCTLNAYTNNPKIINFFFNHKVVINKNIPTGAGLGGGSSNAAVFLKLCNDIIGLNLSIKQLAEIGVKIGADVPFFIYDETSANVSGIGEIIEKFEEEIPEFEIKFIDEHCDTAQVYKNYRKKYMKVFEIDLAKQLKNLPTSEILNKITPLKANDLYESAIDLCPKLAPYKNDWFLSGSGSTLFRMKAGKE
ncbi:4-(cytidine 5'-diphospho)-2-C-methyl-D-erythritol kinase [Nitrosophilus kaiyonis]|uniref:4-(cytidine 5'-diphospho)-2-C-methyl-D-erythritol kinase n=1 Tax=Nitrosophilus kaiyonis TaxID=2930200 RepID=UPI002490C477|nr:4-(cytidine 5'-diphospho)-2-C-methyl-D-erythritol kinase [Nitrosophilus kaiyonis]